MFNKLIFKALQYILKLRQEPSSYQLRSFFDGSSIYRMVKRSKRYRSGTEAHQTNIEADTKQYRSPLKQATPNDQNFNLQKSIFKNKYYL
jgi:hypothetical protein